MKPTKKPSKPHPYGPWTTLGSALPGPNEFLVVTGLGAVIRREGTQPRIQVRQTALRDRARWRAGEPITERLDLERSWWDVLPIGMLPAVHVGQVLRAGIHVATPKYTYEKFKLHIDNDLMTGTCRLVWDWQCLHGMERGSAPGTSTDVLQVRPPVEPGLRWPKGRAGVPCLLVEVDEDVSVAIPCTEIFRYYYGSTSKMAYAVATGFSASIHEWPEAERHRPRHVTETYNLDGTWGPINRKCRVQLRMRMDNEDAPVAGRLYCSDGARRNALGIGASLFQREQNGEVPVVTAGMPFVGRTDLGVHGTWIDHHVGDRLLRTFVVFWIDSCSGKWPFDELDRDRDNRGARELDVGLGEGGDREDRRKRKGPPRPRKGDGETIQPDRTPSLLRGLVKTALPDARFNPPGGLKINPAPDIPPPGPSNWPLPGEPEEGEGVNTGPGNYGDEGIDRLDLVRDIDASNPKEEKKKPPPVRLPISLELFERALDELATAEKWTLEWWTPPGSDAVGGAIPFPVASLKEKRPAWCWIDKEKDQRRHAMVARIETASAYIYVIEVERRRSEAFSGRILAVKADGSEVPDDVLLRLLARCAERGPEKSGLWSGWNDPAYVFESIKHSKRPKESEGAKGIGNYVETFAAYVGRRIQEVAGGLGAPRSKARLEEEGE